MRLHHVLCLLEARPVHLDQDELKLAVQFFLDRLKRLAKRYPPDVTMETALERPISAFFRFTTYKGEELRIEIVISTIRRKGPKRDQLFQGGLFQRSPDGSRNRATVFLNTTSTIADLEASFTASGKDSALYNLRSTISHELTHGLDPFNEFIPKDPEARARWRKNRRKTMPPPVDPDLPDDVDPYTDEQKRKYVNAPHELAAHLQEVVQEVLFALETTPPSRFQGMTKREVLSALLAMSNTWVTKREFFLRTAQNKIRNAAFNAVKDQLDEYPNF